MNKKFLESKIYIEIFSFKNHLTTATRLDKARMPGVSFMPPNVVEEARMKFQHLMHQISHLPIAPGQPDFVHGMVFHSTPHEDVQNFHLTNSAMEQVITTQMFTKK